MIGTRQRHSPWKLAVGLIAVGVLAACTQTDERFWLAGASYAGTVVAQQKPELIPERARAIGEPKDSIRLTLRVDSIRGDSLFGEYDGPLTHLGLMVLAADGSRQFAATTRGSSFEMELNPWVSDIGVWLRGTVARGAASGTWQVEQGIGSGAFTLSRQRDR